MEARNELSEFLEPVLLRRASNILEKYLPPMMESVLFFQLAESEARAYVEKCGSLERTISTVMELRQTVNGFDCKLQMLKRLLQKLVRANKTKARFVCGNCCAD